MAGRKKKSPSLQDVTTAFRLTAYYRRCLRGMNMHVKPWRPDVPVNEQPVFSKFLELIPLLQAMEADYRVFIRAQFEQWNGPARSYPQPAQLLTQSAIERYNRHVYQEDRLPHTRTETRRERERSGFRDEVLKLEGMAKAMHMEEQEVLKNEYDEFSREFLVSRGVWDEVADAWSETFRE